MKRQKQMQKAFGTNEFGLVDFPVKISNVQVSRIIYGNSRGCSWCFPHGWETTNSTVINRQRTWKRFRKTRWKPIWVKEGRIVSDLFKFTNPYFSAVVISISIVICGVIAVRKIVSSQVPL